MQRFITTDFYLFSGVISVNEDAPYANCTMQKGNDVLSLVMMAEQYGLSTGIVSTARLTHATPATSYAHASSRGWENDVKTNNTNCSDIGKYCHFRSLSWKLKYF